MFQEDVELFFLKIYVFVLWPYSKIMLKYSIWSLKRYGRKVGLPSLDGYTDEEIVEGFRRLKHQTPFKEYEESDL
jgi:hypothetical protein